MHTELQPENVRGKDHLGDLCVDGRIILKWMLKKLDMKASARFSWLSIRTTEGLL
jgi:hypothetical protein